jgi:hypothetical protein
VEGWEPAGDLWLGGNLGHDGAGSFHDKNDEGGLDTEPPLPCLCWSKRVVRDA